MKKWIQQFYIGTQEPHVDDRETIIKFYENLSPEELEDMHVQLLNQKLNIQSHIALVEWFIRRRQIH